MSDKHKHPNDLRPNDRINVYVVEYWENKMHATLDGEQEYATNAAAVFSTFKRAKKFCNTNYNYADTPGEPHKNDWHWCIWRQRIDQDPINVVGPDSDRWHYTSTGHPCSIGGRNVG